MIVGDLFASSDALIAAWLPGTSGGQGIIDAISGDYIVRPTKETVKNTLSMNWPRDMVINILYSQVLLIFLFMILTE